MPINRAGVSLLAFKQRFLALVPISEHHKRGTQQHLSYKIDDAHGAVLDYPSKFSMSFLTAQA
jgi:hypothetical protein